jgi:hypothetical protein
MITLIYRKVDRLIVGTSHKRRTAEQTGQAVITEIENICQSELGGVAGDYATVEAQIPPEPGYEYLIREGGAVGVNRLRPTASDLAFKRKTAKLIALGLTQEEIDA